jgi:hypothetical protein
MLYDGTFIKLDEDGRVWLKLYGDFSDPDEPTPSDIQVSDVELLGYADDYPAIMRTLVRKKISLLDDAREQLDEAVDAHRENAAEDDLPAFSFRRLVPSL